MSQHYVIDPTHSALIFENIGAQGLEAKRLASEEMSNDQLK